MTADQSLQIYEILNKYFKNEADAKLLTKQIEIVIEKKVEDYKTELATKKDVLELKIDVADRIHKSKIETIVWIVGIGVLQFVMALLAKKYL